MIGSAFNKNVGMAFDNNNGFAESVKMVRQVGLRLEPCQTGAEAFCSYPF
jgi:hypothetical protein